jgi:hypothetical protein
MSPAVFALSLGIDARQQLPCLENEKKRERARLCINLFKLKFMNITLCNCVIAGMGNAFFKANFLHLSNCGA